MSGLRELGEFGIIGLFRSQAAPERPWAVRGIGDDCAVLDAGGDERLLVTTDMLLERVHFLRAAISPWQLGWKSMAVNLSDIAAMGGEPAAAFLAMGLTPDLGPDFVTGFRDGLLSCARRYRTDLLGGDTVSARSDIALCLTVLGRAREGEILLRSGARPGDTVALGRIVGDSAAGLALVLGAEAECAPADREQLRAAHLEPQPQVALGRLLGAGGLATAAIDVSDGVFQDLGHICEESGVGAELDADRLPLSDAARRLAAELGRDPVDWGLAGGEDYCLLVCLPPEREAEARRRARDELGLELAAVGRMVEGAGVRLLRGGRVIERLASAGYDHFGGGSEPEEQP